MVHSVLDELCDLLPCTTLWLNRANLTLFHPAWVSTIVMDIVTPAAPCIQITEYCAFNLTLAHKQNMVRLDSA